MRSDIPEAANEGDVSRLLLWFVIQWSQVEGKFSDGKRQYLICLREALTHPAIQPVSLLAGQLPTGFVRRGDLVFTLEERLLGDRMERWIVDGQEYSIMAGSYIHDLAPHIIRNILQNQIDGLMLDTTWDVMRQYVAAIMVAISRNTAIALGFAFGPAETIELYEQFYTEFAKHGIDLSDYVFEADQGPALVSVFKKHGNLHLICLHHFLKTLKDKRFAVYVANLVRARTEDEFARLCQDMVAPLRSVLEWHNHSPDIWTAMAKEFGKAGLTFDRNTISVGQSAEEQTRWLQVSMLKRVAFRMPPTTGCLESMNGHLNEETPRNNTFWASAATVQRMVIRSMKSFGARVRHNYNASIRKSINISLKLGDECQRQIAFYQSTVDDCPCG
jgi:hypothetical protein